MAFPYVKQTWTDGVSQTTAARMGVIEQGIFDAHTQPTARVRHTTAQTITTATFTVLAFNTERWDIDGLGTSTIHDNATNNSRLTAKVAGKYQITAHIEWDANATGRRELRLLVNGTTVIAYGHDEPESAIVWRQHITSLFDLAVNDYVEAQVFQNSGGNLDVTVQSAYSPEFMMVRVA